MKDPYKGQIITVVMSHTKDATPPATKEKTCNDKELESSDDTEEDDTISKAIGEYGRWQLQLTFLLSLFNLPCTFHIYSPTFQAAQRDFWCALPSHLSALSVSDWRNYSQTKNGCSILDLNWSNISVADIQSGRPPPTTSMIPCTSWQWNSSQVGDTVISEWDLVCDRSYLNNVAEMSFLAGVALGGLVSGVLSDKFGRKKTLMTSLILQTTIGVSISFAPWLELYLLLRTFLGFISVSVVFSGFVLALELVGGKWRTIAGVSNLFPLSLAYITISGIAWLVRDWRHLQLAISLPGLLLFGLWWVLPESPRWLLAMGRKAEVVAILKEAAAVNKRELPTNLDKTLEPPQDDGSAGILDLFRTRSMRKTTLCLFAIWFTVYLVYYGLVLNVSNIGGDIYVNSVLAGVVEIPAIAVSILFLLKLGRRWPLCLTLVLSGIACFGTLLVPSAKNKELQWLTTTLAMIGKFSVSSSNAVLPVFTAELFPTVIRNLGVGASNMSAGIALMLVPYLWLLSEIDVRVPMGVLGFFGIAGGLCVLFLPETGNRPLAGTVQEQEERQVEQ